MHITFINIRSYSNITSAGADDETGRQNTSNRERMCDTSVEYMKDLPWDITTWELSSDI